MSVEGFVRASGALMGLARESFGSGGPDGGPGGSVGPAPQGPAGAQGAAANGFDNESGVVGGHVAALDEHDRRSRRRLHAAVAGAAAGRDRMDAVIDGAEGDAAALAPGTSTAAGKRALVAALSRRLHDTKGVLDDGQSDAATHAADADVSAAGYNGLGQPLGGAAAMPAGMPMQMPMMPPMAQMPELPMQLPMMPLSALSSLAGLGGLGQAPLARSDVAADPPQALSDRPDSLTEAGSPAAAIGAAHVHYEPGRFSGGRGAYRDYIAQALDVMGITDPAARTNWTRGLQVGIGRESGFNPDAVNRSDGNAHGPVMADGAPANSSRGGMQTIPATFAAYHQPGTSTNIYDPVANLCAAMNYLMSRYRVTRDGSNLMAVHQFNPHHSPQGF